MLRGRITRSRNRNPSNLHVIPTASANRNDKKLQQSLITAVKPDTSPSYGVTTSNSPAGKKRKRQPRRRNRKRFAKKTAEQDSSDCHDNSEEDNTVEDTVEKDEENTVEKAEKNIVEEITLDEAEESAVEENTVEKAEENIVEEITLEAEENAVEEAEVEKAEESTAQKVAEHQNKKGQKKLQPIRNTAEKAVENTVEKTVESTTENIVKNAAEKAENTAENINGKKEETHNAEVVPEASQPTEDDLDDEVASPEEIEDEDNEEIEDVTIVKDVERKDDSIVIDKTEISAEIVPEVGLKPIQSDENSESSFIQLLTHENNSSEFAVSEGSTQETRANNCSTRGKNKNKIKPRNNEEVAIPDSSQFLNAVNTSDGTPTGEFYLYRLNSPPQMFFDPVTNDYLIEVPSNTSVTVTDQPLL